MTEQRKPMICPKCGGTMNQHCEKIIDPRNRDEARLWNAALRGVVHEMHSCPSCGANASRVAV